MTGVPCCNANGDPCCPSLHCGAPITTECKTEMVCTAAGGTYDPSTFTDIDGDVSYPHCTLPSEGGPADAHSDSKPGDASTE